MFWVYEMLQKRNSRRKSAQSRQRFFNLPNVRRPLVKDRLVFASPPHQHVKIHTWTRKKKKWRHAFLHFLHSCIHMFPDWVPLLQRPLHPRPLVLWRRGWLRWRLWRTPLLQWVSHNSLTPWTGPLALCVWASPHYQLLGYCVFVSLRQSASVCWCERVLWVM